MEQKDYILREIEKIGLIIRAIGQRIFGGKENLSLNLENQIDAAKGMLLSEINFDLDKFLLLDIEESNRYLENFDGFSVENLELLADYISQIGFNYKSDKSKIYIVKALQLYEISALKSKTYSIERERNIITLKNALQHIAKNPQERSDGNL